MNGPNFLEINQRFEKRALDFAKKHHMEYDMISYIVETCPDIAVDMFEDLSRPYKSDIPVLMARMFVLDPFDNPEPCGQFAEEIGMTYESLFDLIVNGIEPDRTA